MQHFINDVRVSGGARYLVLYESKEYDSIYNKIRYLVSVKSGITYIISQNYSKMKDDLHSSLPLEETMTFYVIILIKSIFNKDKNNYYHNIFLEKASYELPEK